VLFVLLAAWLMVIDLRRGSGDLAAEPARR
jgi:hypothetical protein